MKARTSWCGSATRTGDVGGTRSKTLQLPAKQGDADGSSAAQRPASELSWTTGNALCVERQKVLETEILTVATGQKILPKN